MTNKTKSSSKLGKMSDEERQLLQQAIQLATKQLGTFDQTQGLQDLNVGGATALTPGMYGQLAGLQTAAEGEGARAEGLAGTQAEALQTLLNEMRNGGQVTPEQAGLIDQATNSQLALGKSSIDANTMDQLQMLREELAPARGLRSADTPILDRGGLIAREGMRSYGDLEQSLRGQNAQMRLQYPLTAGAYRSGLASGINNYGEDVRALANTLRERAFQNRAQLLGNVQQQGLGLASGTPGNLGPLIQTLDAQRPQIQTQSQSGLGSILGVAGPVAGGIGGVLSGGSAAGWF